jgi:hypothetical protein
MAKPVISPEQFVALVNERIQKHHSYKPGMKIRFDPDVSNPGHASGYGYDGPDGKGVFSDVEAEVSSEYGVSIPPRLS